MASVVLSEAEKVYVLHGIQDDLRTDGRGCEDYRGIEVETDVVSNTTGSARVKIGHTDILVGVKAEMGTPKLEHPDKGYLEFFADWDEEVIPGALCRQRSPGGIQIIWPGSWDQTYVHSLSLLPSPPTRDSFATIPRLRGDKEPTSGSKTKTTRKCAVCMKKLSSSYKKSLCKECTDKIISEERPSLIEEIKTLIQQEIKTSLATLSQPTPSPSALLRLRKGNLIHRRKSRRTLRERRRRRTPRGG
ncbi:unnamed protein product [Ranitomeya imitator]|uniref:Ribosomal RNA-processing protein 42 n=1 Tax=Ranitomeya imitator TaxID=111125 RepID=A0ABN9MK10_9NEOB|nr:unnamed protein product [Ranitomeya imitator]